VKRLVLKKFFAGIAVVAMGVFFSAGAVTAGDLEISGFVDASYVDTEYGASTFGIDQVEIDFEKKLDEKVSLRADIEYVNATDPATSDVLIEQGYLTYALDVANGIDITIGKFNAPIGFELLDAPDMYQYSHANVFNFGIPTNLTGVMGAYKINDQVDAVLYVVNGWDNNTDSNSTKTIGGRIGIAAMEGVDVGLSYITGPEGTNNDDKRSVFDIDATITLVDNLIIGIELNFGEEDKASLVTVGNDAEWTAYLLMGHYDFNDIYGLTVRYDVFDDEDGARLGNSVKEEQKAITIAPTFVLGENAGMLIEYQLLESDKNVFAGNSQDSQTTIAVEFTYKF
jgi:hypothetical protein